MEVNVEQHEAACAAFLAAWPLDRLRTMTLQDYTATGRDDTFTAWIEQRLDKCGSIWGGSSFKFGIYSRKTRIEKPNTESAFYTPEYAWYSKYGETADEVYAKVHSLVRSVAEAAARGAFAAIDSIDLGEAYKWKIAYHYQDRQNPGVLAAFKSKRLKTWLKNRSIAVPKAMSDVYRAVLADDGGKTDLVTLSARVWQESAPVETPTDERATPEGEVELEPTPDDDEPAGALNLILYGPPGTGKTFATAELAVKVCDGMAPADRASLMKRYRELKALHRIRFVTFHPSFTYEEFVEGIRPTTENGQVRYDVRSGIFKQAATHARELFEKPAAPIEVAERRLFKMSLGDIHNPEEAWVFADCRENDRVCLGFVEGVDFAGANTLQAVRERYEASVPRDRRKEYPPAAIHRLKNEINAGDLIVVSEGNRRFRAVAEVIGPYTFLPRDGGYEHTRRVRWLWVTDGESLPVSTIYSRQFSQASIYAMDAAEVKRPALQELVRPRTATGLPPNCVLVIDEINRANLAKTFGELITLLEPSKRIGQVDEQETDLPYSGDRFGVPPNLHVIGTMNTADRSIALLDVALRRRFDFREMAPRPELLAEDVAGINLRKLLVAMNWRIETLIDRDHTLGHTYLMNLGSFEELAARFRNQIIPLLQEYFFEDWGKIRQVFRDEEATIEKQIVQRVAPPEGEKTGSDRPRFRVNPEIAPAALQKIYESQ